MKYAVRVLGMIVFTGLLVVSAFAEVPKMINYSGKIINTNGSLPTGDYNMIFRFYSSLTATASVWEEQHVGANQVHLQNGLYNVVLGKIVELSDFSEKYYLETVFDGVTFPRQPMISSPYAMRAEYANHVITPMAFNGEIDISSHEGARIYFYLDAIPKKVMIFIKGRRLNPLFYTEVGTHTHTHSSTHSHSTVLGSHDHGIWHDNQGWPVCTNTVGENYSNNPNIIVATDLGTKVSTANSPGSTDATGLMPDGAVLHTGSVYTYLDDMRFLIDGVDKTANLLSIVGWTRLGDGMSSHPFNSTGTGFLDITSEYNWTYGQHYFSFNCAVGGRVTYTIYIYY